jgi:hypothetical protein
VIEPRQLIRLRRLVRRREELTITIATAVQRGRFVYVYDDRGRQRASLLAGNGPNDGLVGYTGSNVSIRRGAFIYTYDAKGRQISSVFAQ